MIISPEKTLDIEIRMSLLEAMEIVLRHGYVEEAKEFGEFSHYLKNKTYEPTRKNKEAL